MIDLLRRNRDNEIDLSSEEIAGRTIAAFLQRLSVDNHRAIYGQNDPQVGFLIQRERFTRQLAAEVERVANSPGEAR
jgi:hypothetical protein